MAAIAAEKAPRLLDLAADRTGVSVIEALALLAQPDAHGDGQAELLRPVEQRLQVVLAPGPQRVPARLFEGFEVDAASAPFDRVRSAVAQEVVAGRIPLDLDDRGHVPAGLSGDRAEPERNARMTACATVLRGRIKTPVERRGLIRSPWE